MTGTSGLDDELERVLEGRHADPASVLGRHADGDADVVRAHLPGASEARLPELDDAPLVRVGDTDLFEWRGDGARLPARYRLCWTDERGTHDAVDPYAFPVQVGDLDLHLFGEGRHWHAQRFLGAHVRTIDGVPGVRFAVWAPHAERVSVVGDFDGWDDRRHPMRVRDGSGVWELFVPGVEPGALYKLELRNAETGEVVLKADPYARRYELRPGTASVVEGPSQHTWTDDAWIRRRRETDWQHAPMSVYEVHLGSWARAEDGGFLGYRELAERLGAYVAEMGFTHVELMPITEHPLDASWGYQSTGFYAPTSRFGTPDDLRAFVDHLHGRGIGVLLDWVPGHFPKDAHALARFDGLPCYEYADPRLGEHPDWGTLVFDFGRNEVRNFLLSSALFWLESFHLDGLRIDAVASMLYLDYSREEGEWVPNVHGGNEHLEAIGVLRHVNEVTQQQVPGAVVVAEESTAWPQVTEPPSTGGLGFSMKWNMGWMHDTLVYMAEDPIHRRFHHDHLTFGLLYAFDERFVLPLSHDEVVHEKGSMIDKMPGDDWQRFANLRVLYAFMYGHPGKQLLFMGNELAQVREWSEERALDWELLERPPHEGIRTVVRDLNALHRDVPALHRLDFDAGGFEWIDADDAEQSLLSFLRRSDEGELLVVVLNFTPVPRHGHRIGVPGPGRYVELMNTDSRFYGGTDVGNGGAVEAEEVAAMGRPWSLALDVPPLGALFLRPEAG